MAVGTVSDIQVENEFIHAGWTEVVAGTIDGFNAASNNTIRFVTEDGVGDYLREDYFKAVTTNVNHRDPTSTSAQTAQPLAELRQSKVKVPRKFPLTENTLDSMKAIGFGEREFNIALGRQLAAGQMQNMLDTALLAADAALDGQASNEYDGRNASPATLTIQHLLEGLKLMGDASEQVRQWAMHSAAAFDLMKDHVTNAIDGPANLVIIQGGNASAGRPILRRDAAALWEDKTTDEYNTLGLVENAIMCQVSGPPTVLTELVGGGENIKVRFQAEYDFYLSLKGFSYDETNGGAAPTDATLATSTNWDKIATDAKDLCGVRIRSA